jgi:hypothetical protein
MNRKLILTSAVLLAAVLAGPRSARAQDPDAKPRPREIEKTFAAGKLQSLRVDAQVGDIELTAGAGDQVVLKLRIEAKQKSSGILRRERWGDPNAVELVAEESGDTLRLDLREKESDGRDGLFESWTISAPARLAVRLRVQVGKIDVVGIAGGSDLHVNVGDINARLSGGNIEAAVNVGNVRVETSTPSYGNIDVETNVGDISVDLGDHRVRTPKPPGAGNHFRMDGPGRDRIKLKANVGDARLTIRKAA